jgi:FtsH-binding integral membrane protein
MAKVWLTLIGLFGSVVCCIMLGVSFKVHNFYFSDIHLWTFMHQTALAGAYFFSSKKPLREIWWLLLAVSPSAFLQKVFINIIPGGSWDYVGTDDPTGNFWSMVVFGIKIMVPRLANMHIKLAITAGCILLFFALRKYLLRRFS